MKKNRICILILSLFLISKTSNAQHTDFSINIDFIGVTSGCTSATSLPCDTLYDSYNPISIAFVFTVTNKSAKKYFLFGSNTLGYYREDPELYMNNDVMGMLYLVNNNDSILLLSRKVRYFAEEEAQHSASIDYIESLRDTGFEKFLCQFVCKDEVVTKRKIFNYLKKSKLVYVPVVSDYEYIIQNYHSSKSDSIAYPKSPIEIKMPSPFYVGFGILGDYESGGEVLREEDVERTAHD